VVAEFLKNIVRATVPRELRNWLRSPSRSAEWLWDSARGSFGTVRSIKLLPNVQLLCHPYAYKIYRQAQIDDPEQREEFLSFASHCWSGMLLFDIGAHFGVFSLTAAKLGGKAVAIDPSPISCRMLSRQAVLNNCAEKVQTLQAAVSDSNCVVGMLSSGVFTPGYFKITPGRLPNELIETRALTVDDMSRQFGAPTHVKIDVEGHETAVLRGAKQTLERFAPLLFLELHNEMVRSASGDPSQCLIELHKFGYTAYRTSGEPIERPAILKEPVIRIVAQHPHGPVGGSTLC
jgi:FkbM family methyltransferase